MRYMTSVTHIKAGSRLKLWNKLTMPVKWNLKIIEKIVSTSIFRKILYTRVKQLIIKYKELDDASGFWKRTEII